MCWFRIRSRMAIGRGRCRVAIGGCRGMMDWGWVTISGGRFRMAIGRGRSWVMDRGMMDWGMVDWGMVDWGMMDWGMVDWGMVESGGMMDWGMVDWGRMRNWVGNRVGNWVCNSGMRRCRAIKDGTSKLGFASDKGEEGEDCKYLKKILNHFIEHNTNTILKKVFQIHIDLFFKSLSNTTFFKITFFKHLKHFF